MGDLGTFTRRGDVVDLRYERFYARPVETVWSAFTQPERLSDWLSSAIVEPHSGGRYELFTGRPRPMTGRILAWEPPHVLEFSWDTGDAPVNRVRVELTAEGGGTRLIFQHFDVPYVWAALTLPGWHNLFDNLAAALAGTPRIHGMDEWKALQGRYVAAYALTGVMLDPPPGHSD